MLSSWLPPSLSRKRGRKERRQRSLRQLERLEDRVVPTVQPVTLANPSQFGLSGQSASANPSISADGQLVAFVSTADNLVPNDTDNAPDVFVYSRATGAMTLVSVGVGGTAAGIESSVTPVISPDGRSVVFGSSAGNLVPGFTNPNGVTELYLRNLTTGVTSLLSVAPDGQTAGDRSSRDPVFSADSHHLGFISDAGNLVAGVTFTSPTGDDNVFERNLVTGTNALVSVSVNGASDGDNISGPFGLSADGNYVAFQSNADNLVTISNSGIDQVYERDMLTGTTSMVSIDATGQAGAGGHSDLDPAGQIISADGRYVVFHSGAGDVISTPTGGSGSYVRDMRTDTTYSLSAAAVAIGGAVNNDQGSEVISPDGRWAAFAASGSNVTAQDTTGRLNVFIYNIQTGALSLASIDTAGTAGGNGDSGTGTFYGLPGDLFFSPDGAYLAFQSDATNLTSGVVTPNPNLYARDLDTNQTFRVSPNQAGTDGGNGQSFNAVFSASGQAVAFVSAASNLVAGDTNGANDVFVRDFLANTTSLVSLKSPLLPTANLAAAGGTLGSVSSDGTYVAFASNVGGAFSDLAPGVNFGNSFSSSHVFVRNQQNGTIQVVDLTATGVAAGGSDPVITPDGRHVAFIGFTNLLPAGVSVGDVHDEIVYVRDLQTGITSVVSVNPTGTHDVAVVGSDELTISPDGRYVAYTTVDPGAVAGTQPPVAGNDTMVILRDTQTGSNYLVSHDSANDGQIRGLSNDISLSTDGRFVLFVSTDPNLAANDTNNAADVFEWDRTTGQVALVSVNAAGTGPGDGDSYLGFAPVMTPNGRYVAFTSDGDDLVANAAGANVFRRDTVNGTTVLVSVNTGGTGAANADSFGQSISADGSEVAFTSNATDWTTDPDNNNGSDVFVRNFTTSHTTLVSINAAGTGTATSPSIPNSSNAILSANGRYVEFASNTIDLVNGFVDGNGGTADIYLRDLQQGKIKLITVDQSGTAGADADEGSDTVQFSGDSSTLIFDSPATDLIPGDRNYNTDVFAVPTAGFSSISGVVFNDANGNHTLDGGESGIPNWTVFLDTNGNGTLDAGEPFVFSDAVGAYSFTGLAPGAYTVAVVPHAGYLQTLPTAPTTYAVTINTDGTAVLGKNFGEELPLPDLATSNVAASPSASGPGQPITVTWTVTNRGNGTAAGSWQDAVYLSPTPTLGTSAVLLTTVSRSGGLATGQSYLGSTTVNLPALAAGSYYVIVQADWRNQVSEGAFLGNKANNIAGSASPITLSVPTLVPNTPVQGIFTGPGRAFYYQISVAPGQTLGITLNSAALTGADELYVRRGAFPDPSSFDFAARTPNQPNQMLSVPTTSAGTYFILVRTLAGAASTSNFTLTASLPTFQINAIDVRSGGDTGTVTIPIHGSLLTTNTKANLVSGSTVIPATAIFFQDASLIFATFNLTGRTRTSYDVQLKDGAQTSTLPAAFAVVAGVAGPVRVALTAPSLVRANGANGVIVTYTNTGNTDAVAPLITLTADFAQFHLPDWPDAVGSSIEFLGISADGPAGTLRPGETGQITVPFLATSAAGQNINFTTQIADDTRTMNWATYKASLKPANVPSTAWDAIFANFTTTVGGTIGSYHAVLANDASYLSQLGEYTPDVARLLEFELFKAGAGYTTQTLTAVTDVRYPEPGLNLTFVRQFNQSMSGRFTTGPFGLGWTDNWQISAVTDAQGNVEIEDDGVQRYFLKQPDGSFMGTMGDHATLSFINGAYQLRETDGAVEAFNANGTLKFVQDTNGNRITCTYQGGLLTKLTAGNGDKIVIGYTGSLITSVTDPAGEQTTFSYDATNQHLVSYADKFGAATYTYLTGQTNPALNNALSQIAYADSTHLFFSYDTQGRLVDQHRDGNLEDLAYTYGTAGGFTVTDGDGNKTTTLFDDTGNIGEVIDPLGQVTRFAYDANNNLIKAQAPLGITYTYTYDANGNVLTSTDALGNKITYTYDPNNNLTSFTDAKGNTTKYGYDSGNNLLSITYANGAEQQYSYNPLGEAAQFLNARGDAVALTYNAQGLVTGETFKDNTTLAYQYDVHGNLTKATDQQGHVTKFVYGADPNNPQNPDLLTEVDYPDGTFLKFSYNIVGQRLQSVDQTGFTVKYTYDALGRLSKLTDGGNNLIVQYTFDAAGNLTQKDMGNGTRTVYTYDADGNVLSITNYAPDHITINSFDKYGYDAVGHVLTDMNQDGLWSYGYDADGQLTQAVFAPNGADPDGLAAQNLQYVYDAAGNRISETVNGVITTYAVNTVNEYSSSTTASVGVTTYQYDLDGNLKAETNPSNQTTNFTFNDLNQLTAIGGPGLTATYTYDPLGGRVSQTINGATTRFQVDPAGLGNIAATFNGSGTLTAHFTYGLGLVSQVTAGGADYYDFGLTGNTTGITAAAGAYANKYAYLPFGAVVASSGTLANPFTFVGQFGVTGDGSGLLNMRARSYDPSSGQFTSNDPLGLAGGDTNIRRYVGNDPVGAVDPLGLNPVCNKPIVPFQQQGFGPPPTSPGLPGGAGVPPVSPYYYLPPGGGGLEPCGPPPPPPPSPGPGGPGGDTGIVAGFDPNELIGPAGFGTKAFVAPQSVLPYAIGFENDPTKATAAAQNVTVTEQLDPNLDWTTFQFGDIQIGSITLSVPAGQSYSTTYYTTSVDGTSLEVKVNAILDEQTGLVTWTFLSLDPATGQTPSDPIAGFLPVDDSTGRGQAFVNYTVQPKATAATGTAISAQATDVFDTNAPLTTNTVVNTVDAGTPTSTVTALPVTTTTSAFTVRWSGTDDVNGSGIATYDVYVADNGGPFAIWQSATAATSAAFTGQNGHSYAFFSVATDNVGNQQPTPAGAQTSTVLAVVAPQIQAVVVNDGKAQRSEVRSLTITFSDVVTFAGGDANAAAAFQLAAVGGGAVTLGSSVSTDAQGHTVVTLTFTSGSVDPVSAANGGAPSLADGRYQLTVLAAAVGGAGGSLDGDANGTAGGNYVSPTDTLGGGAGQLHLYRIFGDATGDGIIDQQDLGQLRSTFNVSAGSPQYLSFMDADNTGTVDQVDLAQFRTRFNQNVFPPQGPVVAPPTVTAVVVNDGSAQRSEVRSITVTFSRSVAFAGGNASAAAAFQLAHVTDGIHVGLTANVATDAQGRTVVTLTFAGSETDPTSAQNGGVASLADGRYSLTILAGQVSANGRALDGAHNGTAGSNYASPPDTPGGGPGELHLYRLFGDVNGDGIADQTDLGLFRSAINSAIGNPYYLSYLDADNSGAIDLVDLGQFRSRFNANVF